MSVLEPPRAAQLRGQIREWRRGRAELNFRELFSDAYIAAFTVVMIGSMAGNVVLNLRRLADASCTDSCAQVRTLSPLLSALAVSALALGVARLLGPVFSPPAANAWLLSTPVDRSALLRPGWLRTSTIAVLGATAALIAPVLLGGLDATTAPVFLLAGGATSLACVGLAALSQIHEHRAARLLTWLVTGSLWVLLALAAGGRLGALPGMTAWVGAAVAGLALVAAGGLTWRVLTTLPTMSRRVLGHTEHLSPSLSGALSSLDLGLMYDVLLARRWGPAARVTSHTGGPRGWWALVHRDLRRAQRSPQPFVVLAGMALIPYAAASAGAGRPVVLATTFAGLLAGPPLCSGLRVVTRTSGLARMLPFDPQSLRSAHLVVPGLALLCFGLATSGSLRPVMAWSEALLVGVACGLSVIAATMRWVSAKPPDYARPLVSTPAGGLPPGVMGSVLRGVDVWAITALPLTFPGFGVWVSLAISGAVITFLLTKAEN